MRKFAIFTSLAILGLPALAQAATGAPSAGAGIPSSVFWAGGIAAFLGFFLGSFPPNRGDMAATEWDMQGALSWAVAAALIAGGFAFYSSLGDMMGVYAVGAGAVIAAARILLTRPPRVPTSGPLEAGINRAPGDTPSARMKAAKRMFNRASFGSRGRFATRSPRVWDYGTSGVPASDMAMMTNSCATANSEQFAILVLLVRELPGETGQPAVVVVQGTDALRQLKVDASGFQISPETKISAQSVASMVGYAWR